MLRVGMPVSIDSAIALVTGASSGIGTEIARQLAPRVKVLVLVARRKERLEALARELEGAGELEGRGAEVVVAACDLTDRDALDQLVTDVEREHGAIDLLLNNAGMGDIGMFDLADWDKTVRMLELNVRALTYLTHRIAPSMVAAGRGGILMISSGFGLTFAPGFAAYVGSKHYVTGLSESLRLELRPCGVTVTQVCPGPVATEFEEVAGNFTGQKVPGFLEITAQRCARDALRGLERGKALVVPGLIMRVVMFLAMRSPRFLLRLVHAPGARWMRDKQRKALGTS